MAIPGLRARAARGPRPHPRPASGWCRLLRLAVGTWFAVVANGAVAAAPASPPGDALAQASALEPFALVDQWPSAPPATQGLIGDSQGLDVDADDRVFISDRLAGGVVVMQPDGVFLPPFGTRGAEPPGARLVSPGRLAVDQARKRVFVLDNGSDRVVAYDLDGRYVADWRTPGVGIAVAPDGSVFVADVSADRIRVFDSVGTPSFSFGGHGLADGELALLTDVSVSPDGKVAAVGDKGGLRVQLFDVGDRAVRLRRVWDLQRPEYDQAGNLGKVGHGATAPYMRCRSGSVTALGEDAVWVGDGTGSCILRPDGFDYTIGSTMAAGAVCKLGVRHPRVRPDTAQYVALATYDPNAGPCWHQRRSKETRLDTSPAVVRFRDDRFRQLESMWLATDERPPGALAGPWRIGLPAPGRVFVQDATDRAHVFDLAGAHVADHGTRDVWAPGRTQRTTLELVDGGPAPGEVFGYYRTQAFRKPCRAVHCRSIWVEHEHGIGRYKTVATRSGGRDILVVEPIWERPLSKAHPALRSQIEPADVAERLEVLEVLDLRYNAVTGEVLALTNAVPDAVTARDDVALVAFLADGVAPPRTLDLDERAFGSAFINTYTGIGVGPSGQAFVLDRAGAAALVVEPNGQPGDVVPVAGDTLRVAGGPDGTLFALLRSGFVERRRLGDATVTARFDARPGPASDPGTLSDLAVGADGRVFVAERLTSQVLVFAPAAGAVLRPSEAGACGFSATKWASPERLLLGDTTRVTLGLDGHCSPSTPPTDVVILTQGATRFPLRLPLYRAIIAVLADLDLNRHRVGLVEVVDSATLVHGLSQDRASIVRSLGRLPESGRPNLRDALNVAQKQFTAGDGRRHVVLIMPMYYCSREVAMDLSSCRSSDYVPAESAARAVAAAGTVIVVDDNCPVWQATYCKRWNSVQSDLRVLASSSDAIVPPDADPIPYLLDIRLPGATAIGVEVVDGLPDHMALQPNTIAPPAAVIGSTVRWALDSLPDHGATFSVAVQPRAAGRLPTNTEAVATFTDGWGMARRVVFPIPEVEIVAPEPTSPPPATASPTATPTAAPTVTPRPASPGPPARAGTRVFLPAAWRGAAYDSP